MKGRLALRLDSPKFIFLESVDSTNNYLKQNYQSLKNNTFVRTNFQTEGYGQFDRVWESEKDANILFSVLYKDLKLNDLNNLKEAIINALLSFLKTLKVAATFVEPNDIYVNNKKILGILIETKIANSNLEYVIIGVGINVNQTKFETKLATSIKLETNESHNINNLYQSLIKEIIEELNYSV